MALTKKFAFFLLVLGMDVAAAGPFISATPPQISPGLSPMLDVNCTFSLDVQSGMAAVISLILSRADSSQPQNFVELASVNQYSNGKVNLLISENVTARGDFNPAGESFLHLQWDYPSDIQAGVYKCVGQGLDRIGHVVVMADDAEVKIHTPSADDYNDKFMNTLLGMMSSLENYRKTLEQTAREMGAQMVAMENNCNKDIASNWSTLTNDQEQLLWILQEDFLHRKFEDPLTYGNHTYYISKEGFHTIYESIRNCTLAGGYVAIMDDADEYNAIRKLLHTGGDYSEIIIAGRDEINNDTWLLPSGQPVPYLDWRDDQPNGSGDQCIDFCQTDSSFKMCDLPCKYGPYTSIRYMCEIPQM